MYAKLQRTFESAKTLRSIGRRQVPPAWNRFIESVGNEGGEDLGKTMARPSTLTIASLKQMLNARRSELAKLQKRRAAAARELASLDRSIARVGGSAGAKGGRAHNEQSLTATLQSVLKSAGKPMGVGEILEAVEASGYRSSSANFRGIINQTLIKERKYFTSAGRGIYQLKK
jgi:hypothetical protein